MQKSRARIELLGLREASVVSKELPLSVTAVHEDGTLVLALGCNPIALALLRGHRTRRLVNGQAVAGQACCGNSATAGPTACGSQPVASTIR